MGGGGPAGNRRSTRGGPTPPHSLTLCCGRVSVGPLQWGHPPSQHSGEGKEISVAAADKSASASPREQEGAVREAAGRAL